MSETINFNKNKLYIQNMVCRCCKMTVANELKRRSMLYTSLELGEVHLAKPITALQKNSLKTVLQEYGLELMDSEKAILVEKIVAIIVSLIHGEDEWPDTKFSVFLTKKLNRDYHYLSTLFSKTKGVTIEHFIAIHKVERIKELIMYDELNLTEISYQLNYSSVAHLSNQFKRITGLSPSFFRSIENKTRITIEDL